MNIIMNVISIFLQMVGAVTLVLIISIFLEELGNNISDKIRKIKYEYKYKHRFDNPPTAKCYCIDCCHYEINSQKCFRYSNLGLYTSDNSFCSEAVPRKHDIDIEVINNE